MGSSSGLLVQVLIGLAAVGPAFIGGMFARRRTRADVEVTLSAEARGWANTFAEGAKTAADNARAAIAQATEANERAANAEARVKDCHGRVDLMERHIATLETIMREHGISPPTPPWAHP